MASITNAGPFGRRRWGIWALLRSGAERRVSATIDSSETARARRFYPPQRDRSLEKSAMAREMYRL